MKKFVSIILIIAMVAASSMVAFADIDYSQWNSQGAYPSDVLNTKLFTPVKFLVDKKVVSGYEDGLFHPERTITRAEFTKMVLVATNNDNGMGTYTTNKFTDVSDKHWAKQYINTAAGLKLINGRGDGIFDPEGTVSYAEVIAIFVRTKGVNDAQLAGTWPNNYANYATRYNMLGTVKVTDWNAPATRGDVAWILYRNLPKSTATTGGGITP